MINQHLIDAIRATQIPGYEARIKSGYRPGDKRQHGKGNALDVELIDKRTGKVLPNYQSAETFPIYEQYAHGVKANMDALHPETAPKTRWGGYFSGGKGRYGALDLMHFDVGGGNGLGMLGGSFESGLTPAQRKIWGLQNVGFKGKQGQGLADAGFKSYNQRQQPIQDKFPIQMIPGVDPQEPIKEVNIDMPITQQAPGRLVDFSKAKKEVNRNKLLAQMLSNVDWGDPNQIVSGNAVAMHPLTALAKTLQTGMGAYYTTKAQNQESDLETQKAQAFTDMLGSGEKPDINALVNLGIVSPDKLAGALVNKSGGFVPIYGENGEILSFAHDTGEVTPTGKKSALYSPNAVRAREAVKQAMKGSEYTDEQGNIIYGSAADRNPATYGQYAPPRYDQPTSMMPVDGAPPAPIAQPAPLASPVKGQSKAAEAAAVAQATLPTKVQEQKELLPLKIQEKKAEQEIKTQGKQDAPLPPGALQMQQEHLDAISTANAIKSDIGTIAEQLESGMFELGSIKNAKNEAKLATGIGVDDEARRYGDFKTTIKKIVNDSLRLNKGTQTEGDAQRASAEIFNHISDTKYVAERLRELELLNKRASDNRKGQLGALYENYGKQTPDLSKFENQPSVLEAPKTANIIRYDAQGNRVQ